MLTLLTLLYLSLPYFFFAWGWLRWSWAAMFSSVLLLGLFSARKRARGASESVTRLQPRKYETLLVLVITVVVYIPCGVGGIGYQQYDWLKHNAVLNDLSTMTWPVVYEGVGERPTNSFLTYYLAYYLPAAAVGRILGLNAAHLTLFIWTLLGLFLCALWVVRLVAGRPPVVWAAWFALSGMDALGVAVSGHLMEWWSGYWQYSSNVGLLIWVPQHFLPGWIASALIVHEAESAGDLSLIAFAGALTSLWSPFITIGLIPLGIVIAARRHWSRQWSAANFLAAAMVVILSILYLASVKSHDMPHGFIFQVAPALQGLGLWFMFCMAEFGIYAALLWPDLKRRFEGEQVAAWTFGWYIAAIVTLATLPLYIAGKWNDLGMRASIPSLFLMWIILLRLLVGGNVPLKTWRGTLLLGCLLIGAVMPAKQWLSQVASFRPTIKLLGGHEVGIVDLPDDYLHQYMGRQDSFFYHHLSSARQSDGPIPVDAAQGIQQQ